MTKVSLSGFCTLKQISDYFEIDVKTMKKKIEPLQMFIEKKGKRKRLYSPEEVELIKNSLRGSKGS